MASSLLRSSLSTPNFTVITHKPNSNLSKQPFNPLYFSKTKFQNRLLSVRSAVDPNNTSNNSGSRDSTTVIKEAAEQFLESAGKVTEKLCEKAGLTAEQLLSQTDVTTSQLKVQAEKTSTELRVQCEKAAALLAANAHEAAELTKETLAQVKDEAPEPVKDLAEIAIESHSKEAARKGAVIHDFCLGIPYGALLLIGGLAWFVLAGSINALRFGVIMGSALLYSSISSLKSWKAGKNSSLYIIIQGVLSTMVFIAEVSRFSSTRVLFPTAITATISAAMIGFYAYVISAGGNPPKKTTVA